MGRAPHALVVVALTLALTACDSASPVRTDDPTTGTPTGTNGSADSSETPSTAAAEAEGCLEAEPQPLQEGGHLLADAAPPVPYSSVPPTSGWHASGTGPTPGAYGEPLSEPELVLWLEKGGIAVAYAPGLPEAQVRELAQLPEQVQLTVVTPYETPMPTPIALLAWGVLQRCETVDAAVLEAFGEAHAYQDRSD